MSVKKVNKTTGSTTKVAGLVNSEKVNTMYGAFPSDASASNKLVSDSTANEKISDESQVIFEVMGEMGAKNLLKNEVTTNNNWYGVSRTVNADFSITLNGTSTAWAFANFNYAPGQKSIPSGTYIISGGCENTALSVVADGSVIARQYGSEETVFTITDNMLETYARFEMSTDKTFTSENSIIKPMIRLASITDDTYEPYAKTNQELTKETTGLIDSQNIDGCKNHFGMSLSNTVDNGITYQVNENNTITANGTVTSSPSATVGSSGYITGLIIGETYVLSGLPESTTISGGSYAEAFIKLYKNDSSYSEINTRNNKTLTFTYDGTNAKTIDVGIRTVGTVVTNAVFKPMICLKSLYDADTTYAPYAKSNRELTEIVDPLKTQFDADHNIVKTISNIMNIYWTGNAMPSDWSNLTTQQATDIAQALYDVFKKIGGAGGIRYTGLVRQYHRKASDGSELASSVIMVDIYSNSSYNSMLSNNANARFTLVMHPYGETSQVTYSLWGNKLMCSNHGINNAGTVSDYDKLYTYNTISTYKG